MAHSIEPNRSYAGGESAVWKLFIQDGADPMDLTNAEVEWYLLESDEHSAEEALLSHEDPEIDATVANETGGRVDVTIDQDTTDNLAGGIYYQRLVVDDLDGGKQKWGGEFPIDYI